MRRAVWAGAVTCSAFACARSPAPEPPTPEPAPVLEPGAATPEDSARARALYAEAEARFRAGDLLAADSLAGIVVDQYASTPSAGDALWLRVRSAREQGALSRAQQELARYVPLFPPDHPRRLSARLLQARLLLEAIEPWAAADTLLSAGPRMGPALRDSAAPVLREALGVLSLADVNALVSRHPARSPLGATLHAERALQLAAEGRLDAARQAAERALDWDPLPADAARAREVLRAEDSAARTLAIAAVLPLSGDLAPYGRNLLDGITLAVEEHNRTATDSVLLVVVDDSSSSELAARRVAELEARRVLGIVGPVADDALRVAAARRTNPDLALVSPLARQIDDLGPNVYSLWFSTEDLERLARTVAEFGVRQMGARRVAVVFPGDPVGFTQYEAFAREARLHGAEIIAAEPYGIRETTYEGPLTRIDSVNPEAVYAVATDPRAVIQLAPQLAYYGMRGIQIFGDPNWVDPEPVRILDPRFLNGTVVATYLDRFSPESRWPEFESLFEARYRKKLGNNIIPALGYDAASLLLRAVPASMRQPGMLARSLRHGLPYRGATGVMQVRGERVQREAVVVEIRDRQVFRTYPHPIQRPPEPPPADSVAPAPGRRRGP